MVTSTELATRPPQAIVDVQFNDTHLSTIRTTAKLFAASGMFPDAKSEAQAFVKIMAGRELNLPAMFSMTKIYVIEGKVTVGAEVMAAKIKASGKYNYKVTQHDNTVCMIEFYNNGEQDYVSTFSIEDARTAGLIKDRGNWQKYPRAMLFSKALSQGARIVCPEVINGVYTPEDFGIDTNEDGTPKDIRQVVTVIPQETIVDEVTGEILDDDDPSTDLAPGAHTANQAPMGLCPIHHKPFVEGKFGWYCKTKDTTGKWCKEKPQTDTPKTDPDAQEIEAAFKKERDSHLRKLKQDEPNLDDGPDSGVNDDITKSPDQATIVPPPSEMAPRNETLLTNDQCIELSNLMKDHGVNGQAIGIKTKKLGWPAIQKMGELKVWQLEELKAWLNTLPARKQ